MNIAWFPPEDITAFPPVVRALREPDGLLATGGNLSLPTLVAAYRHGVFPWFDEHSDIMWWSPCERAIITTDAIHVSKNMGKLMRQGRYSLRADTQFSEVIAACGARCETWITDDMRDAYLALHDAGIAHSIEVYNCDEALVGGLYGVFVKNCFCGESMFSREANTSKLALIALAQFLRKNGCTLIDCQMYTPHLAKMGAKTIFRSDFIAQLYEMDDNIYLSEIHWAEKWQAC